MNKPILFSAGEGANYLVAELKPNKIEISGNYSPDDIEAKQLTDLITHICRDTSIKRFIFNFPQVDGPVAIDLAERLGKVVQKAAFILHPNVRSAFKKQMFWDLCVSADPIAAYFEALRLVAVSNHQPVSRDEADERIVLNEPEVANIPLEDYAF